MVWWQTNNEKNLFSSYNRSVKIKGWGIVLIRLCPIHNNSQWVHNYSFITTRNLMHAQTTQKHGWPKISSNWMTTKQKLFLLFPFSSFLKPSSTVCLPDSITLGSHNIPFSDSARNLGFILDSKLSMKKHVIKICQTAYFVLKRISSICRFLTEDTARALVTSYPLTAWLLQMSPHGYT